MNATAFTLLVDTLRSASSPAVAQEAIKKFNLTRDCGRVGLARAMDLAGWDFLPVKRGWFVGDLDGYVLEPTDETVLLRQGVSDCGDNLCPRCACDPCRCVDGAHESNIHE